MSGQNRPKRKATVVAMSAVQNSSIGKRSIRKTNDFALETLLFCDGSITLYDEFFSVQVLDYLPKPDLVHRASLVTKAWNQATKNPHLWTTLSSNIWNMYYDNEGNSRAPPTEKRFRSLHQLFLFLQRPQFANLKTFVPPYIKRKVVAGDMNRLAKICPLLEELDLSGRTNDCSMSPYSEEIMQLPELFPRLQKFHVSLKYASQESVEDFARCMGERLVEFSIVEDNPYPNYFHDETMEVVAQHCPNLEVFIYDFTGWNNSALPVTFSGHIYAYPRSVGAVSILHKCRQLRKLKIVAPEQSRRRIALIFEKCNGYANLRAKVQIKFTSSYYTILYDLNDNNDNNDRDDYKTILYDSNDNDDSDYDDENSDLIPDWDFINSVYNL